MNNKTYKSHLVNGIGCTYDSAFWDIYYKLKKKHIEILKINRVRVYRIAFAFDEGKPVSIPLADCMPIIPEDLNYIMKYLPKL